MKAVVQRVKSASILIEDRLVAQISSGLVILLGIGVSDTEESIDSFLQSVVNAKLFEGGSGHFSKSIIDLGLEVLLVSQYTLYGQIRKNGEILISGSAKSSHAKKLFEHASTTLRGYLADRLKVGIFGAYMNIQLNNDGPVTLTFHQEN